MNEKNSDFKSQIEKKAENQKDLISKIKEGKEKAKETAPQKIKKARFFAPLIISSILSLVLVGFIEAVNAKFQWNFITTPDFWYRFLVFQFANIMLTLTITLTLVKLKRQKDEKYLKNKDELQEIAEFDKEQPFLDEETLEEDIRRKTNAWKNKIKRKREKWRLKIGDVTKISETIEQDSKIIEVETKSNLTQIETFLTNRDNFTLKKIKIGVRLYRVALIPFEWHRVIKNKRTKKNILKYNYMLGDEYIVENIESLKIKYNGVSKSKILSDVFIHSDENGDEPLSINRTKMLVKKYGVKMLTTALITAFTGSMLLEAQNLGLDAWVNIITKVFILFANAMFAIIDNDDYFQATDGYESISKLSLASRLKQRHLKKKDIQSKELEQQKILKAQEDLKVKNENKSVILTPPPPHDIMVVD